MRGKGFVHRHDILRQGITPAYAGKRTTIAGLPFSSWDHPRVCGEKCDGMQEMAGLSGSPPRMRGKEIVATDPLRRAGITPAYAGKSVF